MLNNLLQSWSNLQKRERLMIVLGFLLVLVTAIYLLFDNIWTTRSVLQQQRNELLLTHSWMLEQAELAEELGNSCAEIQILQLAEAELLELLVSRNRLALENIAINGTRYALELRSTEGNNILQFIHQSACQGFSLSALTITQQDSSSDYLGRLEFSHEG